MSDTFFQNHSQLLKEAMQAIESRGYFSAYPEVPSEKIYGEGARQTGKDQFEGYIGEDFPLLQNSTELTVGEEVSPYGTSIHTQYPNIEIETLLQHVNEACSAWRKASVETRVGCAMEILHRLNKRSFEMAFAVMHTTGQGFMMAFQAGGPHAQDRGLEAICYAYKAMLDCPSSATWEKQVGRFNVVQSRTLIAQLEKVEA